MLKEILTTVSNAYQINPDHITGKDLHREYSDARKMFIVVAKECTGFTHDRIGSFVGCKKANVSLQISDAYAKINIYPYWQKKYESIKNAII